MLLNNSYYLICVLTKICVIMFVIYTLKVFLYFGKFVYCKVSVFALVWLMDSVILSSILFLS